MELTPESAHFWRSLAEHTGRARDEGRWTNPSRAADPGGRCASRCSLLLVEDNPGDVLLVREVLAGLPHALRLTIAQDGHEAWELLAGDAPRPDLILMDLRLPLVDGCELLRRIKTDPALLHIPVLVLTGSEAARDVRGAYARRANGYLVKASDFEDFEARLRRALDFWVELASLPRS
ncbi:MAG TPA: response regulator [Planctomycetota bacterium]